MENDTYNLSDATEIKIECKEYSVIIPVNGLSVSIEIEKIEHYSSRDVIKRNELVTNMQGEISFYPIGGVEIVKGISYNNVSRLSVPELLDLIILKQEEGRNEELSETPYSESD